MSNLQTLPGLPSTTSSPVSGGGLTRSPSPDGPKTDPSGPDHALANLSARQAQEMGLLTSGTYGRTGSISFASAVQQQCLANRLQAKLGSDGSILYRLTWKVRVTPQGRQICALRASTLRTSVNDSTFTRKGWPTVTASLVNKGVRSEEGALIEAMRSRGPDLAAAVSLAGWPTAMAGTPAQNGNNAAGNNDSSRKTMQMVTTDQPMRITTSGMLLTGCSAGMESGGQLNPEHSRWLMGYPVAWGFCGAMAMQSTRNKRKRSSKGSSK